MSYSYTDLHRIKRSEEFTRSYDVRYIAEIRHDGLGTFRILKDMDSYILQAKVENQLMKWDEQYFRQLLKEEKQELKESYQSDAENRTYLAQMALKEIDDILIHTLDIDDTVDWNTLKRNKKFQIPNPKKELEKEIAEIKEPVKPKLQVSPEKPIKKPPKLNLLAKIIPTLRNKKIAQGELDYENEIALWQRKVEQTELTNLRLKKEYDEKYHQYLENKNVSEVKMAEEVEKWKEQQKKFNEDQEAHNAKIEKLKSQYYLSQNDAVVEYCELVLNNSEYPENFPKDFELDYNPEERMVVLDFILPAPSHIPTLKEVKFLNTKNEMKEVYITETQRAKIYDETVYKITLRTLHELFEADVSNSIDAIVFNGWVDDINKATGKRAKNCIVSISVSKSDFLEIELSHVDPKACFKNLRGVGSSKLSSVTAIKPIVQLNREDKRFTLSYEVANTLNEGNNIAAMSWEDFEHLLREIFEKEFSSNGGEVKVTHASRDGGVDAIAFDPDPIRGGKIVIQAKRYTNTVGVSAVRDLYGTVLNEGATKGILVTTADYGPDAYSFVQNKPLTLMNGSNLLYLLERHGHKARIDLAEAKKMLQ